MTQIHCQITDHVERRSYATYFNRFYNIVRGPLMVRLCQLGLLR